mgnify:CR=1 FL=1
MLLGDRALLGRVRGTKRRMAALPGYDPARPARRGVEVLHLPLAAPCTPGRLAVANARYVLDLLDRAVREHYPFVEDLALAHIPDSQGLGGAAIGGTRA